MIDLEFLSQATPLKTVARAVGHEIGDSVLYHSVLEVRKPKDVLAALARNGDYVSNCRDRLILIDKMELQPIGWS